MAEKKRKPGRPALGLKAKQYPLRLRLSREDGAELERAEELSGEPARDIARRGNKREVRRLLKKG